MAKTYASAGTVVAGDVATAAAWNVVTADVNNLIVPAMVEVRRTTDLMGYTNATAVAFESVTYNTDAMWVIGSPTIVTISTPGIYVVTVVGQLTATATLGTVDVNILKNAVGAARCPTIVSSTTANFSASITLSLVATDTVSFLLTISGGSAYVVKGSATEPAITRTRMTVTWIGQSA